MVMLIMMFMGLMMRIVLIPLKCKDACYLRSQLHRGRGRKSCSRRQLVSPGELFLESGKVPLCQILPIFRPSCVTDY